jgi:hypothetical protein
MTRQHSSIAVKKRDGDAAESTTLSFGTGRVVQRNGSQPPLKMRRAMTFSGPSQPKTSVLHPPLSDDIFTLTEPIIPSFLEEGKDMIRRIEVASVFFIN